MSSDERSSPPQQPPQPRAVALQQLPAEWASLHPHYAAGHPYPWPPQHMMGPYAAAVAAAMYHPAAFYPHPSSMAAGIPYVAAAGTMPSQENQKKGKSSPEEKPGTKGSSGYNESQSDGDGRSDNSSVMRANAADHKDESAAKKKKRHHACAVVETSHAAEPLGSLKGRSVTKLPISAPGRAALASATTDLNVGIDIWNSSQTVVPMQDNRPIEANPVAEMPQQVLDERERRERRKQSNRESAKRSRIRKQQECEDLGRKVAELLSQNDTLRAELAELKKACEEVETENARLMDKMGLPKDNCVLPGLAPTMQAEPAKKHNIQEIGLQLNSTQNNSSGDSN